MATKTNTEINGKKYYRIRRKVELADGSTVQKNFYGASKTDAEKQFRRFIEEQAQLRVVRQNQYELATVGDRAEEYVTNVLSVSQKYAKGTIDLYRSAYKNYVKSSSLADIPLKDIKAMDIQRFYNSLDVSQQTLKRVNKFMKAFWKWLVLNDYAPDVISAVELPKKADNSRHEDIVVWSDEDIKAILASLGDHRLRFLVYVLLYTGMRISEVLGLKYSDIRDNIIHVERQYYLGELKLPKFDSRRQIPMHRILIDEFRIHEEWHRKEMSLQKYDTEFVFTTRSGKLYDASNVRTALSRFYKANGIKPNHIHAYRATFCTNLCRCDVPLEVASKLLGHKSLEVTARHYALVRPDTISDAIEMFDYKI